MVEPNPTEVCPACNHSREDHKLDFFTNLWECDLITDVCGVPNVGMKYKYTYAAEVCGCMYYSERIYEI